MFDKLDAVEKRYEELTKMISDPEIIANQSEWQKLMKEHASIEDVALKYRDYKKVKNDMEEAKEMMEDKELKELDNVHNGEIMLLHATSKDNSNILDDVIKQIKEMGYEFRNIDEFEK